MVQEDYKSIGGDMAIPLGLKKNKRLKRKGSRPVIASLDTEEKWEKKLFKFINVNNSNFKA